jgi:cell wall-associated NlpC family hydrolase
MRLINKGIPLKWWLIPILLFGGAIVVGIVLFVISLTSTLQDTSISTGACNDSTVSQAPISTIGENEIPAEYLPIYHAAAEKYNVPWNLLAAHHRVETRFSTIKNMISPVGATGPMQFMVCTWTGWGYPGCGGLGNAPIPPVDLTNPAIIAKYHGYGVDGNGDGKADPNNLEDAIFAAANYDAANGASTGNLTQAVFAYNHSQAYVQEVLMYAALYASGNAVVVSGGVTVYPGSCNDGSVVTENGPVMAGAPAIEQAITIGSTIVGKSPYNWGGGRTQYDIDRRSFDCSSFVRWAFSEAGVDLGPMSGTNTDTLVKRGKTVPVSEMKRGDIIFFDTYKVNGHVAIYLGNGQFLADSSSKGVSIDDLNNPYYHRVFKGVIRRVVE